MMKLKYILYMLLLSYLSACTNELIAGSTYSPNDKNIYVDAIGTQARFGTIVAIGVDSQDNVYVADQGNSRIRKIAPNRQVSTLAGTNQVQTQFPDQADPLNTQLVDLGGLTVYDDTLYFTVKGCIRSIDLKQPKAERKINTFYGKCLNEQEKEKSTQDYLDEGTDPEYLRELQTIQTNVHGALFIKALPRELKELVKKQKEANGIQSIYQDIHHIHRIDIDKKITRLTGLNFSGLTSATPDDKDNVIILATKPAFENGQNIILFNDNKNVLSFIQNNKDKFDFIKAIVFAKSGSEYIFSNWLAKKEPNSQLRLIGSLPDLLGTMHVLNASETVLYSADSRQVYQLVLPR